MPPLLTPGTSARVDGGRRRLALLLPLAVAGLVTWPLAGHAVAAPVPVASVAADVVHLAAASVWLGGLVVLVGYLLRAAHPRVLGIVLPVWSRWAAVAVLWLVAGGVVRALVEVGGPRPLVGTDHGRPGAGEAVPAGGAAGGRRVRPPADPPHPAAAGGGDVRARPGGRRGGVPAPPAPARGRGGGGARVVVLGVSAVLVQTTPGRSAAVEATAAVADSFAQTLDSPLYTLQFEIYPAGSATTTPCTRTSTGRTARRCRWWSGSSRPPFPPAASSRPVPRLLGVTAHHAVGSVAFPVPGDWELRFTIRLSEVDQATVRTVVPVR